MQWDSRSEFGADWTEINLILHQFNHNSVQFNAVYLHGTKLQQYITT